MAHANKHEKEEKEKNNDIFSKFSWSTVIIILKCNRDNYLLIYFYNNIQCMMKVISQNIILKVVFRCAFY